MSSSICFHCIICFESLDGDKRYPVVLPCGHTYVCVECANRIDRCYECRENLFYYVEHENKSSSVPSQNNNYRYHRSYAYNNRITRPAGAGGHSVKVKKRLPLPKNLVLMSLIEDNENAGKAEKETSRILHGKPGRDINDEEFDVELRAILETRTCGTYIVTCKNGLSVYAQKPKSLETTSKRLSSSDSNNNIVNDSLYESAFHLTNNTSSKLWSSVSSKVKQKKLTSINFGDSIQVVSIEDGYAILARRKGYISANESGLKRVSGPKDKACRVEGILYNLFVHWKDIEKQKTKVQRLKKELIKELKSSLSSSTDLTIVPASDSAKKILLESHKIIEEKEKKERRQQQEKEDTAFEENNNSILQHENTQTSSTSKNKNKNKHDNFRTGYSGHSGLSSTARVHVNPELLTTQHDKMSNAALTSRNTWNNLGCNISMCYS